MWNETRPDPEFSSRVPIFYRMAVTLRMLCNKQTNRKLTNSNHPRCYRNLVTCVIQMFRDNKASGMVRSSFSTVWILPLGAEILIVFTGCTRYLKLCLEKFFRMNTIVSVYLCGLLWSRAVQSRDEVRFLTSLTPPWPPMGIHCLYEDILWLDYQVKSLPSEPKPNLCNFKRQR